MTLKELPPGGSPPGAAGSYGVYVCAGIVTSLLFYLFSPALLYVALWMGMPLPPPKVLQMLGMFWLPLKWYMESGLPGGEAYLALLNWLIGVA